ncbi:MAG: tRNA (adenosine(37)-N6)-threonylcarbamoyltransferase complex ATPase subunit type 1 TsaE [Bacteroidetes bacterium 4484_249]|nr:MAG: tRNA (adenosine(37)-N6)-threonylcarbamoyltransferase complex ATPase subunit type 1 TsaE [Bacteroidetes bacterium 4484_249]
MSYKIDDLNKVARRLLEKFPDKKIFAFYGEMGAGKTTFIKSICERLGVVDIVSSPTFAIINVYKTKQEEDIYHFDLYRLNTIEEFYDIGYEDYFFSGEYCFIEWPEKVEKLLPDDIIRVYIEVDKENDSRLIRW